MRPMLATRGTHVPTGEEWVHEVKWDGMRVLVDVRGGRSRLTSRNENDVTVVLPGTARAARGRPAPRRRGGRVPRRDPHLRRAAGADPRRQRQAGGRARRAQPGHPAGLRPAPPRRTRPHPRAARGAARSPHRPGPRRRGLAGPAVVRRRRDAVPGDPRPGAGGDGQQAALLPLRLRCTQPALAEVPPSPPHLVGRRRLAPGNRVSHAARGGAGGGADPRRPALPGPGRQRHRRQGGPDADGGAGAVRPRRQPVRRRGPPGRRPRYPVGGPGPVVDVESLGLSPQQRLRQPSYRGVRPDLDPQDLS